MTMTAERHAVTVEHLRRLATIDKTSLFADAGTLIDTEEGVLHVPFRVVADALSGDSKLRSCRLLYDRSEFADDGVITGKTPKTVDGSDLDAALIVIADGLNDHDPDTTPKEQDR
jgi:hypothetical protein